MKIDLESETPIPFGKVPVWHKALFGNSVNRSTVHRWRTRGARGVKLETFLAGGRRFTTTEALLRFFDRTTDSADGHSPPKSAAVSLARRDRANAYLKSQGII